MHQWFGSSYPSVEVCFNHRDVYFPQYFIARPATEFDVDGINKIAITKIDISTLYHKIDQYK
jgi:hypothetical protein